MKNFDWYSFKNGNVAVHCDTEEKAKNFLKEYHDIGITWSTDRDLLDNNHWDDYKENTCYDYNVGIEWGDLDFYKENNFIIIKWEIEESIDKQVNNYIIYNINETLYLSLNESQVKLLDLLIEEGVIDDNDIIKVDNIEFKTI